MNPRADTGLEPLEKELRSVFPRKEVAPPTQEETVLLLSSLQGEFELLKNNKADTTAISSDPEVQRMNNQSEQSTGAWAEGSIPKPSLQNLLKSQMRRNQAAIFGTGSVLFMLLAVLIDPYRPNQLYGNSSLTIYSITTPLLLLVALLFTLRSGDRGLRSVERITPYPLALIAYSRALLTFLTVLVLALLSNGIVYLRTATVGGDVSHFGHFVLVWLGVTLLTGGSAMSLLFYRGVKAAMLGSSVVYLIWLVVQQQLSITESPGSPILLWIDSLVFVAGAALILFAHYRSRALIAGVRKT
ncbi:hypothetical protein PUW24_03860 [Paenibacillus urinalis]|uniref:ABC transporter permease n=1 Tax=Paenibacillus urinalis TaxID=521520 RepID=A0ABY7X7J9_9BACL|nr:hypothetical protein [Paenibacillus urinalis]WDH98106.1 hypothetical protein PUW24_03860 [Paenibacillus urinalis]WDI01789.1 hypothetical protein PUW25_21590 [Paenibacillus urinalis]